MEQTMTSGESLSTRDKGQRRNPGLSSCVSALQPSGTHIQHGRIPPELHEVLTELALVLIKDI